MDSIEHVMTSQHCTDAAPATDGAAACAGGVAGVARDLCLRAPERGDGLALHRLIRACPPLDVNSAYAYFLLCDHFRATTVLAEGPDGLVGCVTAYLRPDAPETLFVWQVAVHADARGQGLARRMLETLAARPAVRGVRWVETTISPSNTASRRLFASWAAGCQADVNECAYLEAADFAADGDAAGHEAERLIRIGPLPGGFRAPL